ncbi:alkaline-phosphatase-like protein [Thelonectria olida]|uniref:Alkaline-phosphatase-like protein n=1 Tax=Thelonectria olida TaxID=1576542 RepID=A0A9P8W759_9HYPO|nr:alkaline-phosphatase-like protein [Thelonectria olida]
MFASLVPFSFSVIFVSLSLTKLVHLYIHANAVSPLALAVFLPSLLLPDVFVICVSRLALRRERGLLAILACALGCFFSLVLLGGASSQLGFFYQTGNEVAWEDAIGFAKDEEGLKVLLSGSGAVIVSGLLIVTVAWFAKFWVYRAVGAFLVGVGAPIVYVWRSMPCFGGKKPSRRNYYAQAANTSPDPYDDSDSDISFDDQDDTEQAMALVYGEGWKESSGRTAQCFRKTTSWAILTGVLVYLGITTIFRPQTPYTMMSTTLPFAMMEMWKPAPDACTEQVRLNGNIFPFPALIDRVNWEEPNRNAKGWAPGTNNRLVRGYREHVPEWLPHPPPLGFHKWYPDPEDNATTGASGNVSAAEHRKENPNCPGPQANDKFYSPVSDPMKITNLDSEVIDIVKGALDSGSVKIKHVALIMMESLREELFPITMGSDIHRFITASHEDGETDRINELLSRLTPNAEKFTGKPGNWKKSDGSEFDAPETEWNNTAEAGFGGINVQGGFTTSSVSTKSLAAIHCGAWPMPVDKFEEADALCYQPCLPQVLELFNQMKTSKDASDDFLEQEWYPAFFQSVTDGYDRQKKFDRKIGFKHVVTKHRLELDAEDTNTHLEEINYFGYPETALKSHIEAYIKSSLEKKRRMFLSHFTSTTHHPWATPHEFQTTEYLNSNGGMHWHKDFNKYLNTVRWTDKWLGELMQTFEDTGIANETLVIFVGDHGQAFKEDDSKTGTYENGHVSNFRVPIVFKHPHIPQVQYNANATSISIVPTILDLLVKTGSLNDKDKEAATDLVQDYEGQSLIRPYKASHKGRRAWNFGIINGGGRMLSVTSADAPWRLVMPLDQKTEYKFTDLTTDPLELKPILKWSVKTLTGAVNNVYGEDAAKWALEAEAVARWWGLERKRLWGYAPGEVESESAEDADDDDDKDEKDE